jgi:Arc/MetJ family transcription regulator
MRTTVDLDPELHAEAVARARSNRRSLSEIVNDALRQALHPVPPVRRDELTGLGTIRVGHPLTADQVADALDDD